GVLQFAVDMLGFSILCTITGLDEGNTFGLIYHVGRQPGIVLNLKTHISKENPKISTITSSFPQADIYEREIADLLGIKIEGLAEGKRYPLPDDWPADEFPLRKDWKAKKGDTKDA
ncbi:MAG: NADH-quinone oxidoreductase subunit C, partial [Candidatus Omnitrophica bacterium]|nr:NADH-quinone oxidoreductase subunit C [Candidatus Omnitrophota bacterium]